MFFLHIFIPHFPHDEEDKDHFGRDDAVNPDLLIGV